MSVMVGGTGIIGQDMVCGFGNDKKYLKKLPAYGITLPNGVKDTVEKIDGKKTVVQRVGMVEINGDTVEAWRVWNGNYALYSYVDIGIPSNILGKFRIEGNNITSLEKEVINSNKRDNGDYIGTKEYLCLTDNSRVTLVMFGFLENKTSKWLNAYLSENPVHIYYELENPIYTQI